MLLLLLACVDHPKGPPPPASLPNTMDTAGGAPFVAEPSAPGGNPAPRFTTLALQEPVHAGELARLQLKTSDPNGDMVFTDIAWLRNGQVLTGRTTRVLESQWFKKGDRLQVRAVASDGVHEVQRSTDEIVVQNSAPKILTRKQAFSRIDGFQLEAWDVDGDPLSWSVDGGPPGLSIDASGTLHFQGSEQQGGGHYEMEIVVQDNEGAKAIWPVTLDLQAGKPGTRQPAGG